MSLHHGSVLSRRGFCLRCLGAAAPGVELTGGGLATLGGGIPLTCPDGSVIGALGVYGGTVQQDVDVAQAALAAFEAPAR